MPWIYRYRPELPRGRQHTIVRVYRSGRQETVGHSGTEEKAKASIKARRAVERGWKPTGKPRPR